MSSTQQHLVSLYQYMYLLPKALIVHPGALFNSSDHVQYGYVYLKQWIIGYLVINFRTMQIHDHLILSAVNAPMT